MPGIGLHGGTFDFLADLPNKPKQPFFDEDHAEQQRMPIDGPTVLRRERVERRPVMEDAAVREVAAWGLDLRGGWEVYPSEIAGSEPADLVLEGTRAVLIEFPGFWVEIDDPIGLVTRAAAEVEALRKWRLSRPMSDFKAFRKKYEAAGVSIQIMKFDGINTATDDVVDYCFEIAKAVGAALIECACGLSCRFAFGPLPSCWKKSRSW